MYFKHTLGFAIGAALVTTVSAHVSMSSPCVRYTPYCTSCPALPAGATVDHNINAPIGTHESKTQPLCKYSTPYGTPAARWTAGTTVTVQFRDHAAVHGGGHCQFALSYDGGKTFVVVHDELKYCFVGGPSGANTASQLSYSFQLPAELPSGDNVVFAWAWNNALGNREFYMNCADVAITGGGSSFSGPEMLVANYGPDTPFIPEFNGNYETGLDLYHARRTITVTGSGASGDNSSAVPGPYSGSDVYSPPPAIPVAPAPIAPFVPAPVAPIPPVAELPAPVAPIPPTAELPAPVSPGSPAYSGVPAAELPPVVNVAPMSSAPAYPGYLPTPFAGARAYEANRAPVYVAHAEPGVVSPPPPYRKCR